MGNLVTNRINFERRDGAKGIDAFADVLAKLTSRPVAEMKASLEKAVSYNTSVDAPFDMELVNPVPQTVAEAGGSSQEVLLGLALLSTKSEDLVMAYWESRDPILNDMPPTMVMTAHTVLAQHGLAALDAETRRHIAMNRHMDAIEAGRAARDAYRETGKFDATTWQSQSWGTRAHAQDVFLWFEAGNLCAKFDTVNEGPDGWIADLAKAAPDYHFSGVSYDEDTDYSLHFVTNEPGEVSIEESDDPDHVLEARAFVSGMTVEERLEEDRLCHGEDDDAEPEDDSMEP